MNEKLFQRHCFKAQFECDPDHHILGLSVSDVRSLGANKTRIWLCGGFCVVVIGCSTD